MILNLYASSGIDKRPYLFPVNTYRGNGEQIVCELRKLFGNPLSGISRAEIVIDPDHPSSRLGGSPQDLPNCDQAASVITSENAGVVIADRIMALVDDLAGCPTRAQVDPRAWKHLLIYAPTELIGERHQKNQEIRRS